MLLRDSLAVGECGERCIHLLYCRNLTVQFYGFGLTHFLPGLFFLHTHAHTHNINNGCNHNNARIIKLQNKFTAMNFKYLYENRKTFLFTVLQKFLFVFPVVFLFATHPFGQCLSHSRCFGLDTHKNHIQIAPFGK